MQNSHYKIGIPIYNQRYRQSLEAIEDPLSVLFAKKIHKINVRPKLVYYIELDYYINALSDYGFLNLICRKIYGVYRRKKLVMLN
jgi:hypothetical protein